MWKTTDGGNTNWSSVTLPTSTYYLTYISVKNNDPNTLWISYGGYTSGSKVYQSSNGGGNWTNKSTGLPNLPIMCVVQYKSATDRDVLFAGTDAGVYVKNGTNNWVSYNTGLPNVVVTELDIHYTPGGDKLRAGTYGRGLRETTIEAALPVELTAFTSKIINNAVYLNWTTTLEINNKEFDVERSIDGKSKWVNVGYVVVKGNSNQNESYSFTDKALSTGKYGYRLKQVDFNGNFKYHRLNKTVVIGLPEKFSLSQNYPNPFNPKKRIDYSIPTKGFVTIKVYNILGQEIEKLVNDIIDAGFYSAEFEGSKFPSEMYFYTISSGNYNETKRMMIIK